MRADTRHLVDRELLPMVDAFPALDLSPCGLSATRTSLARLLAAMDTGPGPTRELRVPGPVGAPTVRLLVYQPPGPARMRPAIYNIHGGGMVMGTADQSNSQLWRLANEQDAIVVSVDYRLAPEAPYPAALEDCQAGLRWLHSNAGSLGIDPRRIVVVGESAGAGLATSLALLERDKAGPPIRALVLTYPMLDHRTGSAADPYSNPTTGQWIWSRQANEAGWRMLQASYDLADVETGYFSAGRATRLERLPETFIGVGALDLFLDECVDFALRLSRAGVAVEAHLYAGAPHGFDLVADAGVAMSAASDRGRALRRLLNP